MYFCRALQSNNSLSAPFSFAGHFLVAACGFYPLLGAGLPEKLFVEAKSSLKCAAELAVSAVFPLLLRCALRD